MRGGWEEGTILWGSLGLGSQVCAPEGGSARMMLISRCCVLCRSRNSPLVEKLCYFHWGIGGWWVTARLVWTPRRRRSPPGWLVGPSTGGYPRPMFPYMPRSVMGRWGGEILHVEVPSRRHWWLLLVLLDLVVCWWGVGGFSPTICGTRRAPVCLNEAIAGRR